MKNATCDCSHHKMLPVLALLFSILFLLGYGGYISAEFVRFGLPVLVGVAALFKTRRPDWRCFFNLN